MSAESRARQDADGNAYDAGYRSGIGEDAAATIAALREQSERYRLVTLRQDAELAAARRYISELEEQTDSIGLQKAQHAAAPAKEKKTLNTTTELRGELTRLGYDFVASADTALIHTTRAQIEALQQNLTLQGPASVAIIASKELDTLRAQLAALSSPST